MNKNIKKALIFTIICTAFSTWVPLTLNIGAQYAYAYSYDQITRLGLTSGFSTIPIYSSVSHKWDYRVKSGDEIPIVVYSKLSSNQTNIKLSTIETKAADIRVFVGKEKLKLTDIYGAINIAEGEKKSIYIRLYNSKNATDSAYATEYEIVVEREISDDDSDSLDDTITLKGYDDIYLTKLELCNNDKKIDFNFDRTQPIYNINVDESFSYIRIKAVPEQENYKLIINEKDIDTKGSNKNIRHLLLDEENTLVKIRIISSDHKRREYFLNITKEKKQSTTTNNAAISNATTDNNSSENIQTGGTWLYKKADGTMATGWTLINNEWYYFNEGGEMKTGWLQDASGKWYYLKESGVMAKNTVIDGYKIGSDGICVTR